MQSSAIYIFSLLIGLFCLYCGFRNPIWFVRMRKYMFKGFWGNMLYISSALFMVVGSMYVLLFK